MKVDEALHIQVIPSSRFKLPNNTGYDLETYTKAPPRDSFQGEPIFLVIEKIVVGQFPERHHGEISLMTDIQQGWFMGFQIVNFTEEGVRKGTSYDKLALTPSPSSGSIKNLKYPNSPILYYVPVNTCENILFTFSLSELDYFDSEYLNKVKDYWGELKKQNLPLIVNYQKFIDTGLDIANGITDLWNASRFATQQYLYANNPPQKLELNASLQKGKRFVGQNKDLWVRIEILPTSGNVAGTSIFPPVFVNISQAFDYTSTQDAIVIVVGDKECISLHPDKVYDVQPLTNKCGIKIRSKSSDPWEEYTLSPSGYLNSASEPLTTLPYVILRITGNPSVLPFKTPENFFRLVGNISKVQAVIEEAKVLTKVTSEDLIKTQGDHDTTRLGKIGEKLRSTLNIFKVSLTTYLPPLLAGKDFATSCADNIWKQNYLQSYAQLDLRNFIRSWFTLGFEYLKVVTRISTTQIADPANIVAGKAGNAIIGNVDGFLKCLLRQVGNTFTISDIRVTFTIGAPAGIPAPAQPIYFGDANKDIYDEGITDAVK